MCMLNFLRICYTLSQSGLMFPLQCMGVPVAPHPHQTLAMVSLFDVMHLNRCIWYLIVVLICISLMSMVSIFLCTYLLSVYLPKVYVQIFCLNFY